MFLDVLFLRVQYYKLYYFQCLFGAFAETLLVRQMLELVSNRSDQDLTCQPNPSISI